METTWHPEPGSFRDPSGFVFWHQGTLFRQINQGFEEDYRRLIDSGLHHELVTAGLLVPHDEVELRLADAPSAAAVIRPEAIPFVSYPYEWCFSQLKAAALLTLEIHKRALRRGLILRDASAYNVQFVGSRPVFIDTLSFGVRQEGKPWPAYRQFCQHFLGPLALVAYGHSSLGQLSRVHIDGVPLDLARQVLPLKTWLKPGLLMHVHLHGRTAATDSAPGREGSVSVRQMSLTALLALTDSLERVVGGLSWGLPSTLWSGYTQDCNYDAASQEAKRSLVRELLEAVGSHGRLTTIWDLGANTGDYSRVAAAKADYVVSFDFDPAVVEHHFRACRQRDERKVLPLVQDLTNPSSAIGWNHTERRSLVDRAPADAALALALIHHLAIGANVPLRSIAAFFRALCWYLVVEFVPKEDSQVTRMLAVREDIFPAYTQQGFEEAFSRDFAIIRSALVPGTLRTIYLLERR